jgi:glycerophosphoryl diester phosphodiesterase
VAAGRVSSVVVVTVVAVLLSAVAWFEAVRAAPLVPYSWAPEHLLVAHAMGGIDGVTYTDSLDAWEANYRRGYRVFEVDLRRLDDGTVVFAHYQPAATTAAAFKATPIEGRYTPLTLADVAGLMKRYPDAWLMTDIKMGPGAQRDNVLRELGNALDEDPSARDRVIVQAYEEADWRWARRLGFENIVYSLYHQDPRELSSSLDFAAENNIRYVGIPKDWATPSFVEQAKRLGVWVGVYTVNTQAERTRFEAMGIDRFYSDFLAPR